jgi:hypothetical protein
MHNEEIRNRVLIQLYKRYYKDGFASPIDTEQVVQEAGIPSDSSGLAFRNVMYLAQSCLIKGEKPSGQKHPKWISITPYGVETVEIKEKEFAKLHNDIRFKILAKLYEYNFTYHGDDTILVDINFIRSLGLNEFGKNLVIGDINYLHHKGLIEGNRQIGVSYPYRVQITSKGIDAIENVINRSLVSIANSDTNEKGRAEEIANEPDKRSKLQRFRDFVGENAGWIELVANVVRASLTGG